MYFAYCLHTAFQSWTADCHSHKLQALSYLAALGRMPALEQAQSVLDSVAGGLKKLAKSTGAWLVISQNESSLQAAAAVPGFGT